MVTSYQKEILKAIGNGIDTRVALIEAFPRGTVDYAISTMKNQEYLTQVTKERKAIFLLTDKAKKLIENDKDIELKISPNEAMKLFENEFSRQIAMKDDMLKEILLTLPFCNGKYGRNTVGVFAHVIGDYGRGKSILAQLYKEIFPPSKYSYIDCRDIFSDVGVEAKFRKLSEANPHIYIVDEVGNLRGVKLRAMLQYLENHEYPAIIMGNPSGVKSNYEEDSFSDWLTNVRQDDMQTAESFLNRVHIMIFMPKLLKEERVNVPRIIFSTDTQDLSQVRAYIARQRNKSPQPTDEAYERMDALVDATLRMVETEPIIKKSKSVTKQGKMTNVDYREDISYFTNGKSATRLIISLISLARGRALLEDSEFIEVRHFDWAFSAKFHFLKQRYNYDFLKVLDKRMEARK